jgi:hypothetical protein
MLRPERGIVMDSSSGLDPHLTSSTAGCRPDVDEHDVPFARFQPYHFSTRQLARLLVLRGQIQDSRAGAGRYADDLLAAA